MQNKAYCVTPTCIKDVLYAPIRDIDFVGIKRSYSMMHKLDTSSVDVSVHASEKLKSPTPAFNDAT